MKDTGISADAGRPRRGRLDGTYLARLRVVSKILTRETPLPKGPRVKLAKSVVKVTKLRHDEKSVANHVRYLVRFKDPMHMDDGTTLHGRSAIMNNFGESFVPTAKPPTPKMREAMEKIAIAKGVEVGEVEKANISVASKWLDKHGDPERKGLWVERPERVAVSLMVGTPRGTSPAILKEAAREFGETAFGDNYRWGFVIHTNTEAPHAHFVVATRSHVRKETLDINKTILAHWRTLYANAATNAGLPMITERWHENTRERPPLFSSGSAGSYRANKRGELDARSASLVRTMADATFDLEMKRRRLAELSTRMAGDAAALRVRDRLEGKPPTERALKYAERIAGAKGLELTEQERRSSKHLRSFLEANKPQHTERAPSTKALAYAERLANSAGVELSASDRASAKRLGSFIVANGADKTPSPKAVALAERLARTAGVELAEGDKKSAVKLSAFIKTKVEPAKGVSSPRPDRPPTIKALAYGDRVAGSVGVELPNDTRGSARQVSRFINAHKENAANAAAERVKAAMRTVDYRANDGKPPTEKALRYAECIAKRVKVTIPQADLDDGARLRAFIDQHKPSTPRQRRAALRVDPDGLDKLPPLPAKRQVEALFKPAPTSEATKARIAAALSLPPTKRMLGALDGIEARSIPVPTEARADAAQAREFLNKHSARQLPEWGAVPAGFEGKRGRTEVLAEKIRDGLGSPAPLANAASRVFLERLAERSDRADALLKDNGRAVLDAAVPSLKSMLRPARGRQDEGR